MTVAMKIGDSLIESLHHNNDMFYICPYSTYVRECRTVGAVLPRQSGKTTFLSSHHLHESSLMFVHNRRIKENLTDSLKNSGSVICFNDIEKFEISIRGIPRNGLKYSCFIIDEFAFMNDDQKINFDRLIDILFVKNLLHKDFYVIKMSS